MSLSMDAFYPGNHPTREGGYFSWTGCISPFAWSLKLPLITQREAISLGQDAFHLQTAC